MTAVPSNLATFGETETPSTVSYLPVVTFPIINSFLTSNGTTYQQIQVGLGTADVEVNLHSIFPSIYLI
jgi:hypothetical protein